MHTQISLWDNIRNMYIKGLLKALQFQWSFHLVWLIRALLRLDAGETMIKIYVSSVY